MKAAKQIIYTQQYSDYPDFRGELSSCLIVQSNSIHFAGEIIPINTNANSIIISIKGVIKNALFMEAVIPNVLLFDLGVDEVNLQELTDFLSNGKQNYRDFQVLWNASQLSITDMEYLLQMGIIDDFFEDINDTLQIEKKVRFLKKFKHYAVSPNLFNTNSVKSFSKINPSLMFFKRLFDISVSFILLVLLIPLFIFVGLAIKLESRGPIFYISKRVGRHYSVFPMLKFRSMRVGADQALDEISHLNMYGNENESSAFLKIKNDPRVSEVGKFLRKTSIDEFPQLLNVLMGHMSIVGNRPLPLYEAEKLLVNDYVGRFDAPAGITGLWQVIKKDKPDMNEQDRINLDIRYSKECSFLNDLWIILKTPGALLQNQNY
ncbi:MAG: hypothetical protein RL037_1445 [Bacteroidota bacterium]|jgi:lipopolysaccharide/colanic/teichoic acid biosynthesis glycosyltransferase